MTDLREILKERFHCGALWYLEAMERRSDCKLTAQETKAVDLFDHLRETVDAIPAEILHSTESSMANVGIETFDDILRDNIEAAGRRSFPKDATEFLETMNLSLRSRL